MIRVLPLRRGCNVIGGLGGDPLRSDGWDKAGDGGVRGSDEPDRGDNRRRGNSGWDWAWLGSLLL